MPDPENTGGDKTFLPMGTTREQTAAPNPAATPVYAGAPPHREVVFPKSSFESLVESVFDVYTSYGDDEVDSSETDFLEALKEVQRNIDTGGGQQVILIRVTP